LDKYVFCLADEWEKAAALLETPKGERTPEQEAQLKALLDEGTKRETRYKDLEAKQAQGALTKDEETSLKEIREIPRGRTADLRALADRIENDLQQRMTAIREELMKPDRYREELRAGPGKGLGLLRRRGHHRGRHQEGERDGAPSGGRGCRTATGHASGGRRQAQGGRRWEAPGGRRQSVGRSGLRCWVWRPVRRRY
jgi:hypothetical protein